MHALEIQSVWQIVNRAEERHLAEHIGVFLRGITAQALLPSCRRFKYGAAIHGERPLARCAEECHKRGLAFVIGKLARQEPAGNPAAAFRGAVGPSLRVHFLELATQQAHLGMGVQVIAHQTQCAGDELIVAIEKKEILRICGNLSRAKVACACASAVHLPNAANPGIARAMALDDFGGGIRAAVIDQNQLPRRRILREDAFDGRVKKCAGIVTGDDDRDSCHTCFIEGAFCIFPCFGENSQGKIEGQNLRIAFLKWRFIFGGTGPTPATYLP